MFAGILLDFLEHPPGRAASARMGDPGGDAAELELDLTNSHLHTLDEVAIPPTLTARARRGIARQKLQAGDAVSRERARPRRQRSSRLSVQRWE